MITANFDFQKSSIDEFIRILLPEAKNDNINIILSYNGENISINISNYKNSFTFYYKNIQDKIDDLPIIMTKTALLKLYNKNYKWGGLTGVRPTKLIRKLIDKNFSIEEIKSILSSLYIVNEEKVNLIIDVYNTESKYLNNNFSNIYVGIPFCPTKCHYCSFASYEIKNSYKKIYPLFIETLLKEIDLLYNFIKLNNIKIESIYIGGGTPTILNAKDLENILSKLYLYFNSINLKEFTLESGRPETLTLEKLKIAKKYGITRISINPQTFNQKTLDLINRKHTINDIKEKFNLAKNFNFIINMDFILGLKDETTEDILNTINQIYEFKPENLTFHVLALKRASELYKINFKNEYIDFDKIENAIKNLVSALGLKPYYMYRQKNSFENGENVGYAIPGTESLFNIEMIEEFQNTFGIGGGAITKFISSEEIIRIVNPKDPIMYVNEMELRTEEKFKIYERMIKKNG